MDGPVLTLAAKAILFMTSYCPLPIIIMTKDFAKIEAALGTHMTIISLVGAALFVLACLFAARAIFRRYERYRGRLAKLHGPAEAGERHTLLYFITYVIPFMAVNAVDPASIASYSIILVVTAYLYVKSGLVYLNPTLAMLRLNVYKVSMGERDVILITRKRHRGAASGEIIPMAEGIYYERRQ